MRTTERTRATTLRQLGLTYREIAEEISVSKSTLSMWLRSIVLTETQQNRIHGKNMQIRRRFVEYNQRKHEAALARNESWQTAAKEEVGPISQDMLKWIGVALYWGEGTKAGNPGRVRFSNSDPDMIRLIMRWFREICHVPEEKFRASVQIHDDQNLEGIQNFWSQLTRIPRPCFRRPTVRVAGSSQRKQKSVLPYGTLHIEFYDMELFQRILGWIQGLGHAAPSSSGLGRLLLRQQTGVRLPVGLPAGGSQ